MSIVYRGAGHGDMERISALMARAMPRDVVSAMRLGRTLLSTGAAIMTPAAWSSPSIPRTG